MLFVVNSTVLVAGVGFILCSFGEQSVVAWRRTVLHVTRGWRMVLKEAGNFLARVLLSVDPGQQVQC